ncbi:MAG: MFS transporter [Acidimicrobiaceae bacterium]|nr:MFS transporter [Acidimicrobiaceae bacterium]
MDASGNTLQDNERFPPEARNAIIGAIIGWAVDFYDIYLPAGALTPALAFFLPASIPAEIRGTILGIVVVITLIGRPIGAFIFGHFGDVIGRKRTALIAIAGFGVMTLLIAIMPGYATWGLAAVVILTILRLIGGIFMGGEYTAANPLAMEYTPKRFRGIVGGGIQSAYPLSAVFVFFITALVLSIAPVGGINSAYVQWGWRIPFLIGAGLALAFLIYYWRSVEESKLWEEATKQTAVKAPLKVLFTGQNFRILAQVFLMMTGLWFMSQMTATFLVPLLTTVLKLPAGSVTLSMLVANIALILAFLAVAQLGQKFGRRPVLILGGLWTLTVGAAIYAFMIANVQAHGPLALSLALGAAGLVVVTAPWAQATTYINERFPTGIRASSYGIGYSLAVIIPGFYNFYLLGLSKLMPFAYGTVVIVFVGGLLLLIGAWLGPETRDVVFTTEALEVVESPEAETPGEWQAEPS